MPAQIQPIVRPPLSVELADRLRQMILEGEFDGGEKIREATLTDQFGVSRTPLREAMKVLAAEGLLKLIPNRGAVISSQSPEELRNVFPVLAALEGCAGELAATRATESEIACIRELTKELRLTHVARDRRRYFQINQSIHSAILAAARNDILLRSHQGVAHRAHRARYIANLTDERWLNALEEHEEIAAALAARDAAGTNRLMRAHMLNKLASLVASSN